MAQDEPKMGEDGEDGRRICASSLKKRLRSVKMRFRRDGRAALRPKRPEVFQEGAVEVSKGGSKKRDAAACSSRRLRLLLAEFEVWV